MVDGDRAGIVRVARLTTEQERLTLAQEALDPREVGRRRLDELPRMLETSPRTVYIVNRRTVVDQATEIAERAVSVSVRINRLGGRIAAGLAAGAPAGGSPALL